ELELFAKLLAQKKGDNNKIYSLHEPETCCISKGKEHKKYLDFNLLNSKLKSRG
ncbi:MAG: IS5/IS1182 family transposase, partial [Chitinophagia bacterium]|nr:IS5/IS1182 family transposase [Chitinophagia bacterium]